MELGWLTQAERTSLAEDLLAEGSNPAALYATAYGEGPPIADWSSFNIGEFVAPASVWSLAPLLVLWAGFALALWRATSATEPQREA